MDANSLVRDFYRRGMVGRWLTAKQTGYLWSLAHADGIPVGREAGALCTDEEGQPLGSWHIGRPSPINGCSVLHWTPWAEIKADHLKAEAERERTNALNAVVARFSAAMLEGRCAEALATLEREKAEVLAKWPA